MLHSKGLSPVCTCAFMGYQHSKWERVSMCVCVCVCARAGVCVCVCAHERVLVANRLYRLLVLLCARQGDA